MTLPTRQITNASDPLCAPNGAPLDKIRVTFTLVDANGTPCDAWDTASGQRVVGVVHAVTDVNGVFNNVALWPNDRGNVPTKYACQVNVPGMVTFMAAVPSGSTPLTWVALMANGTPLTAQQISALNLHINDWTVHINAAAGLPGQIPVINSTRTGFIFVDPPPVIWIN